MWIEKCDENSVDTYLNMLKSIASLSSIFAAESAVPYIDYRAVENIFCLALNADNLSRSDCSIDARVGECGIGIKTFLNANGKTFQKIAEFNKDSKLLSDKEPKELAKEVSRLRNERLITTKRIYGVKEMIYHCVTREINKISISECTMDLVDIRKISHITVSSNSIGFTDGTNEYRFSKSKNTLYKRFYTNNPFRTVDVNVLDNPYELLKNLVFENRFHFEKVKRNKEFVILPLYSEKGGINVPEKSGLNQWNASGRKRNFNEVYISVPSIINKKKPRFFPPRDKPFTLNLPDNKTLSAKICQEGNKALMSNPNKDLGEWILRQVLNLKEGELLTYKKLEEIGLDSVVIYRENNEEYSINFMEMGSYDDFINNFE